MTENHECECCHETKADVRYVANPYEEEINDRTIMEWLCDACYQECCDDI